MPLYMALQVRAGQEVDNAEIIKFARLFNDELTLDNLERVQVRTHTHAYTDTDTHTLTHLSWLVTHLLHL